MCWQAKPANSVQLFSPSLFLFIEHSLGDSCNIYRDIALCTSRKENKYENTQFPIPMAAVTVMFIFSGRKMSIGVPIKVLHEAEGHIVTCETNTGEVYRGKLIEAEDNMNCQVGGTFD